MPTHQFALLVVLSLVGVAAAPQPDGGGAPREAAERVRPNDNRRPAGIPSGGTLTLRLEARVSMWHPDGDDAPGAPMPAFAEEGGAALIPGPLLRVRAGTEVVASVRNSLRDTLVVHGLQSRTGAVVPGVAPMTLAPGERRSVRFRLSAPGAYYYWGTTTRRGIDFRTLEDAQLTGAIIVDDPAAGPVRDRVLVIGMWTDTVHRAMTHRRRVLGVINGRSWPHAERLVHTVGDTVRWRVINASADFHPMHLHGFYFRVDSRGDGLRDTVNAAGAADMAVTESLGNGSTMSMTWVPERPGNWLFHCHVPEHFGARGPLGMEHPAAPGGPADRSVHADHASGGMNGLVMGITVHSGRSAGLRTAAPANPRRIRLLVRPQRGSSISVPRYSYALHEDGVEPPSDSGVGHGPVLELVRRQPVRIMVVNRLAEPTAVHWHGIELESYYDGVPGFSGSGRRITPIIAPGDSFAVHFTPPRAGTFIYHTHADEIRQQSAGLAGVIIVREAGTVRDPATDIPVLLTEPPTPAQRARGVPLVNGTETPAPILMTVGVTYRLRFVQLSVSLAATRFELMRDSTYSTWRPVAKDGAELPSLARTLTPSRTRLGIGETMDVEITPTEAGAMRLELRGGLRWPAPGPLRATVPILVRPARSPGVGAP